MRIVLLIVLAPVFYYFVFTFNAYKRLPMKLNHMMFSQLKLELTTDQQNTILCAIGDESKVSSFVTQYIYHTNETMEEIDSDLQKKLEFYLLERFVIKKGMSLTDQLKVFLHKKYMGRRYSQSVEGIYNASRTYLTKSFKFLNPTEFYQIFAMINSPNEFHIVDKPKENLKKANMIAKSCASR